MIHYHGGPITPEPAAHRAWHARHAFISFAHPQQLGLAAHLTQSFALDNGAFSFWKTGTVVRWSDYYAWVAEWINHPGFDFAVIPDVIDGSITDNDALATEWPFRKDQAAVVWHINEPIDRLVRLAYTYPRVCIGSSGAFDVKEPHRFLSRAKTAIRFICDSDDRPVCKLHGLRMLNPLIFTNLPLASADSTNIAINIGRDVNWSKGTYQPKSKDVRAFVMAERIERNTSSNRLEWLSLSEIAAIRGLRDMGWSNAQIAAVSPVKAKDVDGCVVDKIYTVHSNCETIQGVGFQSGKPAVFVRFAGCNLWTGREQDRYKATCQFCDTTFRGGTRYTRDELVAAICAYATGFVVCTGGEPGLQLDADLVRALKRRHRYIAVESNGTVPLPDTLDWICISPKAGAEPVVRQADELKLVFPQERMQPWLAKSLVEARHKWISPMDGPDFQLNVAAAVKFVKRDFGWRLNIQAHKVWDID